MARKQKKSSPRIVWWVVALLALGAAVWYGMQDDGKNALTTLMPAAVQEAIGGSEKDKEKKAAEEKAKEKTKEAVKAVGDAKNAIPEPSGEIKARLAIVIDDFGYTSGPIAALAALPRPVTFAILPYRPHSAEALQAAKTSGKEAILHLPMMPQQASAASEDNTISPSMSDGEIRSTVEKALRSLPGVVGVNNHQGSLATADSRVMKQVLALLHSRGLFFVDSRTSSQSVGRTTARQLGVPAAENDLFLDNVDEVDAVKQKMRTAGNLALRSGSAVVIGHARMHTATALREVIPELERKGIRLVFVSRLTE
ncbi:divergent polysaccharide deacetylase family protein [Anaeromusa sp.]|uniref:divergent polysaccharide deacetylase family protein n=1 Tax=Anaeromusa sp. TaxID=1872520 RepID=UPI002605D0C8|nr:divergent polysaccharide deacetylase family protein [Anaeromusa sp.]MDD3159264.1 divergent polysaccharide deacetylase family protein [Anaeromusa sp.]